jgi:hypothetical protein
MPEASDVYLDFVKQMLADEGTRRQSQDNRIGIVVSMSTTLVTLMVAVVAILTGKNVHINKAVLVIFVAAGVLFVLASIIGILLPLLPQNVAVASIDSEMLRRALSKDDAEIAVANVAGAWISLIKHNRNLSTRRSLTLSIAGVLQVSATILLVIAVFLII